MRAEMADVLTKTGPPAASIVSRRVGATTHRMTGALLAGVKWKVYPRSLRLQVGFLGTKAGRAKLFYARILDLGRKAQTVNVTGKSRTGEVEPCPFFVVNESLQVNPDPWGAPIRDADQACHGVDEMRLAGPTYPYPFIDGLHLTCRGQNGMGQMLARVSASEGFGQGWRPVRPTKWYWTSATQFTVEFDMMVPPLVIDTSGAVVSTAGLASAGFMFRDPAAITINSVTVGNVPYYGTGMALQFTLASAPTGRRPQLGYAIARGATQTGAYPGNSGNPDGMRGLLRDSAADVNLYDSATQANWAPSFVIDL